MLPYGKSLRTHRRASPVVGAEPSLNQKFARWFNWLTFLAVSMYRKWLGFNQRRGLRSCAAVVGPADQPFEQAFAELKLGTSGVKNLMNKSYVAVDTDLFSPKVLAGHGPAKELTEASDFIVFAPSRFLMQREPDLERSGQWKANEILLYGFAEAVPTLTGRGFSPLLALLDLPSSISPDVNRAKDLISSLGLNEFVRWLRPTNGSTFTRRDLAPLYACSHVTAGEFGVAWWGSVVLEALSSGSPVITKYEPRLEHMRYGNFPPLSTPDPEAVAEALVALASDANRRQRLGFTGRRWVLKEHSYEAVSTRIYNTLSAIA